MKIITFQQGGTMNLVDYIPVLQKPLSGGGQKKTSSNDKKSGNELEKAIYKVLDENGLQSDSEIFYTYAQSLLEDVAFGMGSHSASQLIQLRKYANLLVNNKKLYDNAEEHMRTHNTGDDYALTTDGKVYIGRQNEKGEFELDTVKISELEDKLGEWTPLTNENLLSIRDGYSKYAFRKDMLIDVGGSIGMEDVMKTVDDVIKRFGTLSKTAHELKIGADVKEGLEGLYKITVEQSNVSLSPEIKKAAAKFILSNLNNNAKNVLKLNAAVAGTDADTYLINTLTMSLDTTYKEELSKTIEALNKEKNGGSDGGDKLTERSFINTVVLGEAVEAKDILLSGSDSVGIKAKGQSYGFRDEAGNKIGMNNLEHIFSQKDNSLGNTVDLNSISIGNTLVNSTDLYKLVYDGTSTLNRMVLPIDEDVYAATGHIKPDFDALDKFQKFKKWSKDNPNASPQEQALKAESLGLSIQYDSNTNSWKFRNTRLFLTTNGYVSSEVINISDSDKRYLSHMNDTLREQIVDVYENYVNYGQATEDSDKKHPNAINLFSMFDWKDAANMYKGMIFMPVLDRGMEYIAASNELVPKSTYVDMLNQRSLQEQQRNLRTTF